MEKRFEIIEKEGFMEGARIIVDTETGVQYLYVFSGYGGGVTPLLDRDGKPLIDKRFGR
ncbi:MAG: xylan 1,4-beta-xylosidase [Oscillospiraceae bacterium]|nr:xylan 1,4-beta-xylosidase [Oscillospiraceae bacterium]